MKRKSGILLAVLIVTLVIGLLVPFNRQGKSEKVSRFGEYQGYSEMIYDGAQRTSDCL